MPNQTKRKSISCISSCLQITHSKELIIGIMALLIAAISSCTIFDSVIGLLDLNQSQSGENELQRLIYQVEKADPHEAANLLRQFAASKNIDIDIIPPVVQTPSYKIELRGQSFIPATGIDALFQSDEKLKQLYPEGKAPSLLQFARKLSFAEIIELYQLGIKGYLSNAINDFTFIVYFPIEGLDYLKSHRARRWLGEYQGIYKSQGQYSEQYRQAFVRPIDVDREEYEQDLREIGVEIRSYDDVLNSYIISLEPEHTDRILALWWLNYVSFPQEAKPL